MLWKIQLLSKYLNSEKECVDDEHVHEQKNSWKIVRERYNTFSYFYYFGVIYLNHKLPEKIYFQY